MLIDRNFKIPFSFLDPLSTHLFRIHGSWKTSFSCQVFFPRLGRLSFKVCILLCLLMPSQQTNSLIASTDLSVTYNKGRGKQAFWSPNTITEKAFSICFDSILNLLFVLRAQCLTLKWLPPWDAGHNALLCKIPSFLSIKMELSVLSLMELLNFFFFLDFHEYCRAYGSSWILGVWCTITHTPVHKQLTVCWRDIYVVRLWGEGS